MNRRLCRIGWAVLTLAAAFPLESAAPSLGVHSGPAVEVKAAAPAQHPLCKAPIRLDGFGSPDMSGGCLGSPAGCHTAY
jgi:hypothetical protein